MIPAQQFVIPPGTRDLAPFALDERGRLRILPAEFWAATTPAERGLLGQRYAIYGLPTVELVAWLKELIGDRRAIEIGAGSGVLAEALGITATDNRMQERAKYRRIYQGWGQPTVKYGRNVERWDALDAVRHYQPHVVIGSWITEKWKAKRAWAGGNEIGVDEALLLQDPDLQQYVLIGNDHVHRDKEIWDQPHAITYPPYVFSRAMNGSPDFVAVWPGAPA